MTHTRVVCRATSRDVLLEKLAEFGINPSVEGGYVTPTLEATTGFVTAILLTDEQLALIPEWQAPPDFLVDWIDGEDEEAIESLYDVQGMDVDGNPTTHQQHAGKFA